MPYTHTHLNKLNSNSHYHTFIQYLDNLQHKKSLSYFDAMNLTRNIQLHYSTFGEPEPEPESDPEPDPDPDPDPEPDPDPDPDPDPAHDIYSIWKLENELDISFCSLKKEHIEIDIELNSTDDILLILEKYPYNDYNKTYNIDLKILHKIKPELESLRQLTGLKELKHSILKQLLYFIQGFSNVTPELSDYKHTILTGPPGTGKTEIAKIMGIMYSKIGILKNNIFKKVTRSDLVGGYLGQTALKTKAVINECLGGVLFIDEAYALHSDDSYAKECVDTLCEALSYHKDELMVIVAGYEKDLEESIFKINKGIHSRFIWRFKIEPYSAIELYEIFCTKMKQQNWKFEIENEINDNWFLQNIEYFPFHGRDMEQLFTYVKISHSYRVYGKSVSNRFKISKNDLNNGFEQLKNNRNEDLYQKENKYGMYV